MGDVLILAVLAKFFIEISPSIDGWTFTIGVVGLAVAAGLGGGRLLRPYLSMAALAVWLYQETQQHQGIAWIYVGLVGSLVAAYLFGRFLRWSSWALPGAMVLAVLGLSMLGGTISRP